MGFSVNKKEIYVNLPRNQIDEDEFFGLLVHELAHYWQVFTNKYPDISKGNVENNDVDSPWEKEAYRLGQDPTLLKLFKDSCEII